MELKLYIPELKDYWYEQKINNDPLTMNYNAGWDVDYFGYNYTDGTINFPKEKWEEKYLKRKDKNIFFAYLVDNEEFIGYCNYQTNNNKTTCGIVIEASKRGQGYSKNGLELLIKEARKNNVKFLYDDFEENRKGSKIFFDLGFIKINEYKAKKFNSEINIIEVRKEL